MKIQQFIFFIALLSISAPLQAALFPYPNTQNLFAFKDEVGRSFMLPRAAYQQLSTHNFLWHEVIFDKKGPLCGAFQITPFFQNSRTECKTDRYFLIHHKTMLLIAGDDSALARVRDVRAEWLGLSSTISGGFGVRPQQMQTGIIFEYNQDLINLIPLPFIKDWQLNICIPLQFVENSLHPFQVNIQNAGTTFPRTFLDAFNQPAWCFDKIYPGHKTKAGVGEVKLCLQSTYLAQDYFLIAYHSGLVIPTGNKQNAEFLFEPLVGYNQHFGIVAGVDLQFPLNRDISTYAFCFFTSLESTFLVRNKQKRTFDLKSKPWSRFLLYKRSDGLPNQTIPGVNVLTRECTVKPHSFAEFAVGWRLEHKNYTIELGYNIWGHDEEQIEHLTHPFVPIYGIAAVQPSTDTLPYTANTSTISKLGPIDLSTTTQLPIFIPITEGDIDLDSAAAHSALNHKAHFAVGVKNIGAKNSGFMGIGGFIDIPQKNGALKVAGFWAKMGVTF
jgi:hypothetical protein